MAPRRNHPRPSLPAEALFACLIDPDVTDLHQSAAAIELASRLLGGLIGIDYACAAEDGPEALMAALERPEVMPVEHSVAGGLSVPQAVLMALAGHVPSPTAPPGAYAKVRSPPSVVRSHRLSDWLPGPQARELITSSCILHLVGSSKLCMLCIGMKANSGPVSRRGPILRVHHANGSLVVKLYSMAVAAGGGGAGPRRRDVFAAVARSAGSPDLGPPVPSTGRAAAAARQPADRRGGSGAHAHRAPGD